MPTADLGREVVDRIEPWIDMVARKLHELIAGSVFERMVRERDAAFGIVALYLGMDLRVPIFALPGSGDHLVQPVHIDDVARICVEAAHVDGDLIVRVPPVAMEHIERVVGMAVRDVVLKRDEIRGLSSGLPASNQPDRVR